MKLRRVGRISYLANRSFAIVIGGIALGWVTFSVIVDAISRGVFDKPILGMRDFSGIALPWMIASGFAWALTEGRHVQMTLGLKYMRPTLRSGAIITANFVGLILFSFYSFISWQYFRESLLIRETPAGPVPAPVYIGKLGMALGITLLAITFALKFVESLKQEKK